MLSANRLEKLSIWKFFDIWQQNRDVEIAKRKIFKKGLFEV